MKILFVTKELPYPVNNGHRMRSINILKGIAAGNTVDIVCLGEEDQMQEAKTHLKDYFRDLHVIEFKPFSLTYKIKVLLKSLITFRSYAISLRRSRAMRDMVEELTSGGEYDCIVCDGIHMMVNVPNNGIKVVLSEHNIESMIVRRYADVAPGLKRWLAQWEYQKLKDFEELTWARTDAAFVCSEDDRQIVCEIMHSDEVYVVPNGVDVENYQVQKDVTQVPNSLIYTGLMGWGPNEDAACYFTEEIYPLIQKNVPDVQFSIVGKNPTDKVKALGEKERSVHVTGFVDDIQRYMCEAEVFIVPIRIGSGTRLKILEALALQMTVISTAIGCEGIKVTDGKDIIIRDTPQGFADAVIEVLKNKDEYKHLGVNGRQLIEQEYSWAKVRQDLSVYLEDVHNKNVE